MSFLLTVPSKTFLLGEYLALRGGASLLLSTDPVFKMIAIQKNQNMLSHKGIPDESPAGKYIHKHTDFFYHYALEFYDPFEGLGGFGASTAQFLCVSQFKKYINNEKTNVMDLLNEYLQYAWNGEGVAPSGADLIAQWYGRMCFFHKAKNNIQKFFWPFSDLAFGLIHTGNKIVTHTHLKEVKLFDMHELEQISLSGLESIKSRDSEGFIAAIHAYGEILERENLIALKTQDQLTRLNAHPKICAAKGCGALGADVIFVLFLRKDQNEVISWIKKSKFNLIKYGDEVEHGFYIRNRSSGSLDVTKDLP